MLYKPIMPFCIEAIDAPQQNAETRILSSRCVDALLCKGLSYVDRSLLYYFAAANNRCVDLAPETLAP
jgi:hypothetical protein